MPEVARVSIAELGPVAEAELALAPLTILVGPNGSGKGWLATALWALHQANPVDLLSPGSRAAGEALARRILWPGDGREARAGRLPELEAFAASVGAEVYRNLLTQAFRTPVRGRISSHADPVEFDLTSVARVGDGGLRDAFVPLFVARALRELLGFGPSVGADELDAPSPFLYLPAARAGLLQAAPDLADRLWSRRPVLADTPAPTVQFLRFLHAPWGPTNPAAAAFEALLGGRFEPLPGARFRFHPDGGDPVPLALASGAARALLPLVALARAAPAFAVVEEPELGLHPATQGELAKALSGLVHAGTRLVLTTHGDLLLQPLNHLLRWGALSDVARQALRARGIDLGPGLLPAQVAAYELRPRPDGRTEAARLEVGRDGVAFPGFAHRIDALVDEARLLDEARWLEEPRA